MKYRNLFILISMVVFAIGCDSAPSGLEPIDKPPFKTDTAVSADIYTHADVSTPGPDEAQPPTDPCNGVPGMVFEPRRNSCEPKQTIDLNGQWFCKFSYKNSGSTDTFTMQITQSNTLIDAMTNDGYPWTGELQGQNLTISWTGTNGISWDKITSSNASNDYFSGSGEGNSKYDGAYTFEAECSEM